MLHTHQRLPELCNHFERVVVFGFGNNKQQVFLLHRHRQTDHSTTELETRASLQPKLVSRSPSSKNNYNTMSASAPALMALPTATHAALADPVRANPISFSLLMHEAQSPQCHGTSAAMRSSDLYRQHSPYSLQTCTAVSKHARQSAGMDRISHLAQA